jgi:hypothetical protein
MCREATTILLGGIFVSSQRGGEVCRQSQLDANVLLIANARVRSLAGVRELRMRADGRGWLAHADPEPLVALLAVVLADD